MIVQGSLTDSYKSTLDVDGFEYHADRSIEKGGENSGTSPHGLLAASVASCKLMVAKGYMDHNELSFSRIDITVDSKVTGSKRNETVEMDVQLTVRGATMEEKEISFLGRIVERGCTMANILTAGGKNIITTTVTVG